MYNVYDVIKPQLQEYSSNLQSIVDTLKIREIFLELFLSSPQIDDQYILTAWISVYILLHTLLNDVPEYRNVRFTNLEDLHNISGDSTTGYHSIWKYKYSCELNNLEIAKSCLSYDSPIFNRGIKTNGEMHTKATETDATIVLCKCLDRSMNTVSLTIQKA